MDHPLIATLPPEEQRRVLSQARRRRFGRREVVFHEGDPGETVHLVVKGHVAVRLTTPMGDTALVRVIGPGELFGELALLSDGPRSAQVVALESAETLALHRAEFDELRRRSPAAADALTELLANEVRRLAAALTEALYLPVERRVWRRLADLVEQYAAGPDATTATIPLTQDEVAQLAGTTRSTVNRILQDAVDAGAVSLGRGRTVIEDLAWVRGRAR